MTQQLTDAQYRILDEAAARGDAEILRGEDASEKTLRSLAARHLATLVTEMTGRRTVVVGARVSTPGWLAWSAERDRRAEAARVAARAAGPIPATADPFAAYANSPQARREAAIDAAFAI